MGAFGSSPRARGTLVYPRLGNRCLRFIPARAGNAKSGSTTACARSVHPRARGERDPQTGQSSGIAGSSPRARGTPYRLELLQPLIRFIPARAGNAAPEPLAHVQQTVHPRARGERGIETLRELFDRGSSPRARGTRQLVHRFLDLLGFIPARAGNACMTHASMIGRAVHPRARGERPVYADPDGNEFGSSPRARGTPATQKSQR